MSKLTNRKTQAPGNKPSEPRRSDQLVRMLGRRTGVSLAQMQEAFGWQPHTARAAISRLRQAGFAVERSLTSKGSIYRIPSTKASSSDAG